MKIYSAQESPRLGVEVEKVLSGGSAFGDPFPLSDGLAVKLSANSNTYALFAFGGGNMYFTYRWNGEALNTWKKIS